jgi:hypothetical protein
MLISGDACWSKAMPACGEASRRSPAERTATHLPERVRAIRRATRRATGLDSRCARPSASTARYRPNGGKRGPEGRADFDGGGPSLLTEDRQKPRRRLEAMHGTRNTVHSIAFVGAKPARCGTRSGPRRYR